ncbi:MAG: murein biosynthesis integral membrane protein MurJ [Planctomycetota bacterium]|jgi:putative peptidoglycan lipid II flippase
MIRGFRQIAGLTFISRILGMLRDMVFAYFFGADWLMTAWTMGFKIPNLARRLFGEGAASASVIPIYSEELEKDPAAARRLARSVVTVLAVFLTGVMLLAELLIVIYALIFAPNEGTRLGLNLAAIMMPFMVCICIAAVISGLLNVHRHFLAPAAVPIVLNIAIIASSLVAGLKLDLPPEQQVYVVAVGVVIAGLLQITMQIAPLRKHGLVLRPLWETHSPAFRRILLLMGPMVLGLTVTQINTLADDLIALAFGKYLSWGAVSKLYYAQRLYQFPLGVLGISLATAIFPELSSEAAKGAYDKMMQVVSRGLRMSIFVAVPATVGLILVARPLIAVLFERGRFTAADTASTAWTLSFYAIGLCGFFSQQILIRAFYSTKDSKVPAITAAGAVAVNVVLNLILIWPLGTGGLALSTAICSYLQVIVLMIVLKKKHPVEMAEGLRITIVKTAVATAVMTCAGIGVLMFTGPMPVSLKYDLIRTGALVVVCAGVYTGASAVLKSEMLMLLIGRRKRKTEIFEN